MKKITTIVFLASLLSFSAKAQYFTIPDANFRAFLVGAYPTCFDASQMLDTTCSTIVNATELHIDLQYVWTPITSWNGFQYFKNLQVLSFNGNRYSIKNLPALPNSVTNLTITETALYSIPALPTGLTSLTIAGCDSLVSLQTLPNTLIKLRVTNNEKFSTFASFPFSVRFLDCSNNAIRNLPAFPPLLDTLGCGYNDSLSVLPTLPNTLKTLDAGQCNISSIGTTLPPGLTYLNIMGNEISYLPPLPSALVLLFANSNQLTAVPALPAGLTDLSIGSNHISVMPPFPPLLRSIECGHNELTVIPDLPPALEGLSCWHNQLTSLPELPATLTWLDCWENQLTSLPASLGATAITAIRCDHNLMTGLPALPSTLTSMDCSYNQLTSLPAFPAVLNELHCDHNQLTGLPALNAALAHLFCYQNHIQCLPPFPPSLYNIGMDSTIHCVPNQGTTWIYTFGNSFQNTQYAPGHFPLCNPTNNVDHCQEFPVMQGHVYDDYNNNNVKDAGEPYRANARIELSNGAFTFSDNNGYYQIAADGPGNYTLTYAVPNYFAASPAQYNFSFSSNDTLVTNDFALQAATLVDSVEVSITPVWQGPNPGGPAAFLVHYENAGTTSLAPQIDLNYNNSIFSFASSTDPAVTDNGSSLHLNAPSMQWGQSGSFVAYLNVSTSAVNGDTISTNVIATANAVTARDSCLVIISGSFDPNDKSATPVLSPTQLINGDYIDYTIRFQNTGTDTAMNVVIADTLSSSLQSATFKVVNTTHPCKITVKNNIAYFEFLNILLPDSNVNELASHGFVRFKIKPLNNLSPNSSVTNKASIYFDYNSPVVTNTAVTLITDPSTVPLKLLSFTVTKQQGYSALVSWNTANEQNVKIFTIETSTDGRNYTSIAFENALGRQYNTYSKTVAVAPYEIIYFRLKSTDIDGRYSYSPVVSLKMNMDNQPFSLLKNPAKDVLNISIKDDALKNTMAGIINAQGSVLMSFYLQHDQENINISGLPAGNYVLKTIKGNKQFVVVK